jgi:hypothetical protein
MKKKKNQTEKNREREYLAAAHQTSRASQSNRGPGHLPNRYRPTGGTHQGRVVFNLPTGESCSVSCPQRFSRQDQCRRPPTSIRRSPPPPENPKSISFSFLSQISLIGRNLSSGQIFSPSIGTTPSSVEHPRSSMRLCSSSLQKESRREARCITNQQNSSCSSSLEFMSPPTIIDLYDHSISFRVSQRVFGAISGIL